MAQATHTYYVKTDSTNFIGMKTGYEGKKLLIGGKEIVSPKGYSCTIMDSIVIVTGEEDIRETIRWR